MPIEPPTPEREQQDHRPTPSTGRVAFTYNQIAATNMVASTSTVAGTEDQSPNPSLGPPGNSGMSGRCVTKSSNQ